MFITHAYENYILRNTRSNNSKAHGNVFIPKTISEQVPHLEVFCHKAIV